jgi:hypothetical protein
LWELLDTWRIKPWFSTQKAAFNKKIEQQLKEGAANLAAQNASSDAPNESVQIEIDPDDQFDDE